MWENLVDIVKSGAAMLQSGKVPPNTPSKYQEEMKKINFMTSKKFFMTFWAIAILIFFHVFSVFILFLAASMSFPTIIAGLVTINCKLADVLLMVLASYLGVQTFVEIKGGGSTDINYKGENTTITETVNQKTVEEYAEKYKGDPSYAPLEWINKNV